MEPKKFFINPSLPIQRQYEALRAYYVDNLSLEQIEEKYKFSKSYFAKLKFNFQQSLKQKQNLYFQIKKTGPKNLFTEKNIVEEIIQLRKKNHSILDIRTILEAKRNSISLDTIDRILKKEGFASLPKRTRDERLSVQIPKKLEVPQSVPIEIIDEEFSTEKGAGPLIFLPLIEKIGIIDAIKRSGFPSTSVIDDISSVLSFIALKILGNQRLSYDTTWHLDRTLGFFAGLNVLPKKSTLSSYSYRVTREMNRKFLKEICRIFKNEDLEDNEFNLDFKAIPHWGDASILEKNWSGTRTKSIKSILALIVQSPSTGYLSYTDGEIKHSNQNDAILDFVDFWKDGRGISPKMLIFDSKFTSYENLNKLNESKEKIKFLTLRRRGKELINEVNKLPEDSWKKIYIDIEKRKHQVIRVHDGITKLRNYNGNIRQIIITDHGRKRPSFLITNDFTANLKELVKKYARRWLVEQEIAEQIAFFQLNHPSSSIVVKVDFDLTMSLVTHNLYQMLTSKLPGFEKCNVSTIYRKFIENGATIKIKNKKVTVYLKKKSHLPILFELPWFRQENKIKWLNISLNFMPGTTI